MSERTRDLFAGPPVEVPLPRACTITGGAHPHTHLGWCSCCHEPASRGVTIRKPSEADVFVFLCPSCVQVITLACP